MSETVASSVFRLSPLALVTVRRVFSSLASRPSANDGCARPDEAAGSVPVSPDFTTPNVFITLSCVLDINLEVGEEKNSSANDH
jgi:hypothetical protein